MTPRTSEWKPRLSNYWKLGAFVFGSFFLVFAALIWLGATHFGKQSFPAMTYLDEAVEGLVSGSSVKFRGVPIGVVGGITVAPDKRHIQVTCNLFLDATRSEAQRRPLVGTDGPAGWPAGRLR
ncbi:MAG: MlaD family protein [Planctomycetota bacterium]